MDPVSNMLTHIYKIPYITDGEVVDVHEFMRSAQKALFKYYVNKNKAIYTTVRATNFWPGAILVHITFSPPISV